MAEAQKRGDIPSRIKRSTPLGTTCFVVLRGADVIVQYYLLKQGGVARILSSQGLLTVPIANTSYAGILVGLATMGSIKHIYWVLDISENEMPTGQAFQLGIANAVFSGINAFLASWPGSALASSSTGLQRPGAFVAEDIYSSPLLAGAVTLSILGILIETVSELQRKSFKADPKNKRKPYSEGLFSLARHINYSGYALWRPANTLAAGGVASAIAMFALLTYNFVANSIPGLDKVSVMSRMLGILCLANNILSTVTRDMAKAEERSRIRCHTNYSQESTKQWDGLQFSVC